MKSKTFFVKSKSKSFTAFKIKDNGLGYLIFNIHEKIAELKFGCIGNIIGSHHKDNDILISPSCKIVSVSTKWYSIRYKQNSTETYLEYKSQEGPREIIIRLNTSW